MSHHGVPRQVEVYGCGYVSSPGEGGGFRRWLAGGRARERADGRRARTGRKEITSFFYLFMLLTVLSLCLDSGVIPIGSATHAYFVAAQAGLTSAMCTCLLINGFIGFQVYEDGTTLSVWLMRGCSLAMFLLTGAIAACTFNGYGGFAPAKTTALFVLLYVVNGLFLFIYVCCQILLVLGTLEDRWPLGDIAFGVFFFVLGQVLMYTFSARICEEVYHFFDGLFFASICNLLAVMMVYKVARPAAAARALSLTCATTVLGLHHAGRPRVQRRHQDQHLGGEGAAARRRRPPRDDLRRGRRERLRRVEHRRGRGQPAQPGLLRRPVLMLVDCCCSARLSFLFFASNCGWELERAGFFFSSFFRCSPAYQPAFLGFCPRCA